MTAPMAPADANPIDQVLRGKNVSDLTDDALPEELRGKTPDELGQLIQVLDAHLRAMHQTDEGVLRDKTPDEQRAFDYGLKLRDKAEKRLNEHRAIAEVFKRRPESVERVYQNIRHGMGDSAGDVRRLTTPEARDRALRALDDRTSTMHLDAAQKSQVEWYVRRDTHIARRIIVTETDAYRTAWQKLVTEPYPILDDDERRAVLAYNEFRAMSEGVTTQGGFAIPVFIDPSIVMTAQGSGNPFLEIAKPVNILTNKWKGVSSAGASWSFDAEAVAVSDDSPAIAQPAVDVFTARGFIKFSIEIGQDWPGFAEQMSEILGEGYDELLIDKFSRGSGSGEPMGIITALDADTTAEVLLTTAGAFGEVDLYNVWKALPQRFRGIGLNQAGPGAAGQGKRASWMMSVGVNNAIRRFGTANVFHASTVNLQDEWVDRLMNRQVYESPYFPDVVATTGHTNQLVVGDFQHFIIARRAGMSVELVQHIVDVTSNRPTGERGWFAWARIGGGPDTTAAFKLLNQT